MYSKQKKETSDKIKQIGRRFPKHKHKKTYLKLNRELH